MTDDIVQMRGITKDFGAVHALRGVSAEVKAGEVLALLGDNAAGKSTLMKVLMGFYRQDTGEIWFDQKRVDHLNSHERRSRGIEMVYQDFALAEQLNVVDNLFLGRELRWGVGPFKFVRRREQLRRARAALNELDLEIAPHLRVRRLSGGQRQGIAIARSVLFDAKLVVMDEPTASLSVKKVAQVLQLIEKLKSRGVSVILITHRLEDVIQIADRAVILKEGKVLRSLQVADTSVSEIQALITHGQVAEG